MYEAIATKLDISPEELERESLRLFLENRLRLVESQLLELGRRYGVKTVGDLDDLISEGKVHEAQAFEDLFEFDYLEDERDRLMESLEELA